jgi:membrane fusion protein (multidrug efflux system)
VSQIVVQPRAFTDRVEVLGVAKGRQSVTITSNTAELITAVHFSDGQAVSKGQVLVELKGDQEDAGIAQAQAQLAQADREYQRWKTLADKGIAAARLGRSVPGRTRHRPRGPGLGQRPEAGQGDPRAVLRPGGHLRHRAGRPDQPGTPIVSLDDVSLIRVDFSVPDRYLPILREGLTITAKPDALPGETFTAASPRSTPASIRPPARSRPGPSFPTPTAASSPAC